MNENKHGVLGLILFGQVYIKGLSLLGPIGKVSNAGPGHHKVYGSVHHAEIGKGIPAPGEEYQLGQKERWVYISAHHSHSRQVLVKFSSMGTGYCPSKQARQRSSLGMSVAITRLSILR